MQRQAVLVCFASLLLLCPAQHAVGCATHNCYPNPSNSSFQIVYELTADQELNVTVFDILGRRVKELFRGIQTKGIHSVNWEGRDNLGRELPSGLYFYKIEYNHHSTIGRAVILK